MESLGLIAGNGQFPFLLLEAARAHGLEVVVAAIREETEPGMDARAAGACGWEASEHVRYLVEFVGRASGA